MYITHDYTTLSDYTTVLYDRRLKSNGERIKTDQIKNCALFECQWNTVSSLMLRIIIALSKCVLRRIFETKEREAERDVTRIACCLDTVLG